MCGQQINHRLRENWLLEEKWKLETTHNQHSFYHPHTMQGFLSGHPVFAELFFDSKTTALLHLTASHTRLSAEGEWSAL